MLNLSDGLVLAIRRLLELVGSGVDCGGVGDAVLVDGKDRIAVVGGLGAEEDDAEEADAEDDGEKPEGPAVAEGGVRDNVACGSAQRGQLGRLR